MKKSEMRRFLPVILVALACAPAQAFHRHPLGPSHRLGPLTKHSGCRVRHALPDTACTPGVYFEHATKSDVCAVGLSAYTRNVPDAQKEAVYSAYGVSTRYDGTNGELDHLVPLELGGTNARANLFPESARTKPGAHEKDQLENALRSEVCDGKIRLRRAQQLIARDWVAAYRARF
jgi:hypothetical protein